MSSVLKVNISKEPFLFKEATYISPGILTNIDYSNLHSLTDFSTGNIKEINITGASRNDLKEEFDNIENKISDCSTRIEHLSETFTYTLPDYCGRVWDETSANPTAKTYCGNLTMLQNLDKILGLGAYLVQNDHSRRKLSAANHYKFPDGSPAKLDGSMGHYQWGWDKPFYITTWEDGNLFYECVSLSPIPGKESYYIPVGSTSCAGHATMDREEERLVSYINYSPRYRGGTNDNSYDNDPEKTLCGKCATRISTKEFMATARKNGKGWYAGTMRMNAVFQVLFHIIMGTRNSQAEFNPIKNSDRLYECGLGAGLTEIPWDIWQIYNNYNPFLPMEYCAELGDYTGVSDLKTLSTRSYRVPIFFGLKNIYGYIWKVSEDEFAKADETNGIATHYIRKSMYSDGYVYGTINDTVMQGSSAPEGDKLIIRMSYKNLEMWPIECVERNFDAYEIYYGDAMINKIVYIPFNRVVFRGGNSGHLTWAGISVIYVENNFDASTATVGSPLCEFTEDFLLEPITI